TLSRHTRNHRRITLYYLYRMRRLVILLSAPLLTLSAQTPPTLAATPPAWVAKSNQNAQLLIDLEARYSPEGAASSGVQGLDQQISVPGPETRQRELADYRAAKAELESRLKAEPDPLVKQDLEILIHSADCAI